MISCHTFELRKEVNSNTFDYWRNKVKDRKNFDKETNRDFSCVENGIIVWFHGTERRQWIKLIVNPSRVLGMDDVVKLWKPDGKNRKLLFHELDCFYINYFNSYYKLNDFTLTRYDLTKNLKLGSQDLVTAYIMFLHNIKKVKGFAPKYSKKDDGYNSDLSFDLKGKTNGVDVTAYDKAAAIKANMENMEFKQKEMAKRMKLAEGMLRIEVKLVSQESIRKNTGTDDTEKRIIKLCKDGEWIFGAYLNGVVPRGDIYKKDKALEIIESNVDDKKMKQKMILLLELIPQKKSLYLAKKVMNDRNIERIMDEFERIQLCPVTISKRQEIKNLKGLHTFF